MSDERFIRNDNPVCGDPTCMTCRGTRGEEPIPSDSPRADLESAMHAYRKEAEKLRAEVERLTRERDEWKHRYELLESLQPPLPEIKAFDATEILEP